MARRQTRADGPPSLTVADGVATLRFERPGEHNRIDPDDIAVLRDHLRRIAALPAVRTVLFRGAGDRTFSSGFTLGAIRERSEVSYSVRASPAARSPSAIARSCRFIVCTTAGSHCAIAATVSARVFSSRPRGTSSVRKPMRSISSARSVCPVRKMRLACATPSARTARRNPPG